MTEDERRTLRECYDWLVEQVGQPHEQVSEEAADLLRAFDRLTAERLLICGVCLTTTDVTRRDWYNGDAYCDDCYNDMRDIERASEGEEP